MFKKINNLQIKILIFLMNKSVKIHKKVQPFVKIIKKDPIRHHNLIHI